MRVKDAAEQLEVSIDLLKQLEKRGLIPVPPRDHAGHRRYRPEDIEVIRRVIYQASPTGLGHPCRRMSRLRAKLAIEDGRPGYWVQDALLDPQDLTYGTVHV